MGIGKLRLDGEPRQHVVAAQAVSATPSAARSLRSGAPSPIWLEDNGYLSRPRFAARCRRMASCRRGLASVLAVSIVILGLLSGCGGSASPRARRRPPDRLGGLQGLAAAAGVAARAGQPTARRRAECVQGAAGRAAWVPGRREQVGIVVWAVPERVPGLPAGLGAVRTQGRVRGRRRQGSQPVRRRVPQRFPVTYPSYVDPDESIARSIQAATYYPQTVFFDRQGKIVFDHAGPYLSASALEHDIRRYALG